MPCQRSRAQVLPPGRSNRALAQLALAACAALTACASTGDEVEPLPLPQSPKESGTGPGGPLYATTNRDPLTQPIGFFLSDIDQQIQAWNRAKLGGADMKTQTRLVLWEENLGRLTRARREELVEVLELGPPRNRSIAAVALGFTGEREAQGPLLAALDDPSPQVVGNALLSLGLLGGPDTPLEPICAQLRENEDPFTRNNAAYAMQRVVAAGARDDCAIDAARSGLVDAEPGVRVQCALTLGLLLDTDSIDLLADLLFDDYGLVCSAAARSLSVLGSKSLQHKGSAARSLANSLDRVEPKHRRRLLVELVALSASNLGDDAEPWRVWAYSMP